ncbi:unnamed protein product [Rodentolepis nana]|uniref:Ig-like domain-containing protein n=1 Tax=Rodentolepis nana TaxID=102285 RepID=A0A0R3TU34_RODNA|nr:unnamed protein product [Rodentolepis nana]
MILACIIFMLLSQSAVTQNIPLKLCPRTDPKDLKPEVFESSESAGLSTCLNQREELASFMHQGMIFHYEYKQKVTISCPICASDDSKLFRWFFIPRSEAALLEDNRGQAELVRHFEKEIFEDMFTGTDIPCLVNKTLDLYIPKFNPNVHLGTYICRHILDRTHASNRIWYHVDVMQPPHLFADPLKKLPSSFKTVLSVKSANDVNSIISEAGKYLRDSKDFKNYNSTAIDITSKVIPITNPDQSCGEFTLTQYRRCYVVIPRSIAPEVRKTLPPAIALTYDLLVTIFKSYYTWSEAEDASVLKTQRKAAESLASELGFDLYYDGKPETKESDLPEERIPEDEEISLPQNQHLYIPCHYTYFRHFSSEGIIPRPYLLRNLYVNMSFKQPCPEVNYMDIINLALSTKDTKTLKQELLGYEEKRYMKVEKVAIDQTENYEIVCGGDGETSINNCTDPANMTIMWKNGDGKRIICLGKCLKSVTFQPQSEIGERVFVDSDCKLVFSRVKTIDEGIYLCYKRHQKVPNQWQAGAFASYRLKIEASSIKFPSSTQVCLGLIIITIWALVLILVWILLSFWTFEVNRYALVEASERIRRKEREMKMAERKNLLANL